MLLCQNCEHLQCHLYPHCIARLLGMLWDAGLQAKRWREKLPRLSATDGVGRGNGDNFADSWEKSLLQSAVLLFTEGYLSVYCWAGSWWFLPFLTAANVTKCRDLQIQPCHGSKPEKIHLEICDIWAEDFLDCMATW